MTEMVRIPDAAARSDTGWCAAKQGKPPARWGGKSAQFFVFGCESGSRPAVNDTM